MKFLKSAVWANTGRLVEPICGPDTASCSQFPTSASSPVREAGVSSPRPCQDPASSGYLLPFPSRSQGFTSVGQRLWPQRRGAGWKQGHGGRTGPLPNTRLASSQGAFSGRRENPRVPSPVMSARTCSMRTHCACKLWSEKLGSRLCSATYQFYGMSG